MVDDDKVVAALMGQNLLSPFSLGQARRIQKRTGAPLLQVLLEHGLVDEGPALAAMSGLLTTPCVSLREFEGDPKLLARVPQNLAEAYRVLPIGLLEQGKVRRLYLGMVDPTDLGAMEAISQATGWDVEPVLVGPTDLKHAIARVYQRPLELLEPAPEADKSGLGQRPTTDVAAWRDLDLDGDNEDYLEEVLSSGTTSPPPSGRPFDPALLQPPEDAAAKAAEPARVKANDFREFMSKSAVYVLSPLEQAELAPAPTREVGSKDLLQAVVRLLIERGIFTEKDILDTLADLRARRTRPEGR